MAVAAKMRGGRMESDARVNAGVEPAGMEVRDMLRKALAGEEFSRDESSRIKRIYRDLRAQYERVLEDSAEDEVKVLAIRHALDSLEAKRMSGPEFVSEVIYSVFVLKDKRKRDRMLRSEIAYRMALAAYFYDHVKAIKKMDAAAPATSELLFQIDQLDTSLRDYRKFKQQSGTRGVNAA
jgi:hypothetical protein